ncbi:hypothetical protein SAMN05192529_12340 [Arachidicoccus rhizosphaerae]|uniref:Uncharacterized protein n=1 Tax=Arachidicoccus rhizosphaerae TaxID=551991 RepID=A0A1H4BQ42_9BACT|nr:hypothetical protein SAMN05192529_12340 [Arachidicoccus rhizosphaerae]
MQKGYSAMGLFLYGTVAFYGRNILKVPVYPGLAIPETRLI